ncbi:hypothetical protein M316_0054 [Nitrincola phage 1M3-16]|uniref:hypothetical protein n=1 Tax=Nitrincola phage 1M3-16 TaxID=1472912 RepID=UPI000444DEF9|nr:hypothetical protein GJ22_gp098 [Nitrincola phage 1M3-16]AHX01119.1 hypothetical protein M316_0054 [Nitrincola phage 1M3-16]
MTCTGRDYTGYSSKKPLKRTISRRKWKRVIRSAMLKDRSLKLSTRNYFSEREVVGIYQFINDGFIYMKVETLTWDDPLKAQLKHEWDYEYYRIDPLYFVGGFPK